MNDINDIWNKIDKEFDADESLEIDGFLKIQGITKPMVAESVSATAEELLNSTFSSELLPKDTKLSKYNIKQQINSGGQSEIYLAQRSDGIYEKTVVIKFIALRYSAETLRKQFFQEMQLLADLNHPGIVPIIDGGITKENQPWLVLEYIDGLHIDEYCHHENLSPKNIIKLFLNICEALNFVHQRGVVHMDIKASNILINNINEIPYPVIIDFGIANNNNNNDDNNGDIFGTAGFSAPEQIAGEKIDQRADIYSLGILLAQLLVKNKSDNIGLLNYKQRLTIFKDLNVNKDLISIVQKAIQENPVNRYQDMESMRTDLNNYLYGLPLLDKQYHIGHILAKTYKRHKLTTIISVLVFFSAIGFWGKYTSDMSTQQQLTTKAKNSSDELFNFMLTDLFTNLSQIGRIDILKLVTEESINHLQQQDVRTLDAKTHLQSSVAYANAGKVFDALDLSEQALQAYENGLKSLSMIKNNNLFKKDYLYQVAHINNLKGLTLTSEGQQQLTEQVLLESIKTSDHLYKLFPEEGQFSRYESHTQLGWYYMEYEKPQKALEHITLAIETAQLMSDRQLDYKWLFNLSQAYQVMAWYQFDYTNSKDAISTILRAVTLANRTVDEDGNNIKYFFNQSTLLNQLSYFYLETNQTKHASDVIIKAINIGEILQQRAPKNKDYLRELSFSYTTAGQLAEQQNNLLRALETYNKGLTISQFMSNIDKDNFSTANDYASDLIHIGSIHEKLQQIDQANILWNQAIDIMKPVHLLEPNNKYYTTTLIYALVKAGNINQAKPLILELNKSGFNDSKYEQLLKKYNL